MKIILGTANLNNNYGRLNNFLSVKNFKSSIKILKLINSKFLETSFEYDNSIKILKKINLKDYHIILKINIKDELDFKKINDLMKKIKINSFYCIMIHDQDLLSDRNIDFVENFLQKLIENGITKKIGISLYKFENIKSLFKRIKFNIVQLPFNIFDQRLMNNKLLRFFKEKKIEIHARSIFLQGTILKKDYYQKFRVKKKFEKFIISQSYTKLFHCLNFIKQHEFIKKVVIGINNYENLIEIVNNIKKKKIIINYAKFKSSNIKLIDPNAW